MFDLTTRSAYTNVPNHYRHSTHFDADMPIVLVLNKVDHDDRKVKKKHITFHRRKGIQYFDISVRIRFQVMLPFLSLVRDLVGDQSLELIEDLPLTRITRELEKEWYDSNPPPLLFFITQKERKATVQSRRLLERLGRLYLSVWRADVRHSIDHYVTSEEYYGKLFEALTKLERYEILECLFLVQWELWKVEGIGTPPSFRHDESIRCAEKRLTDGFAVSVLAGVLPFLGGF